VSGGAHRPSLARPATYQVNCAFTTWRPESRERIGANRSASGPVDSLYAYLSGQGALRAYVQGSDDIAHQGLSN